MIQRTEIADVDVRQGVLASEDALGLIHALDAELTALYWEDATANHFRLDAEEVAPGRGKFLIAYAGDEPVACGAIRMLDATTAEFKRMYVKPNLRRQGLGFRILEMLETEARRLGANLILLETGPRQPEALALYAKAGFSTTSVFGDYPDSPLSVFMRKEL